MGGSLGFRRGGFILLETERISKLRLPCVAKFSQKWLKFELTIRYFRRKDIKQPVNNTEVNSCTSLVCVL